MYQASWRFGDTQRATTNCLQESFQDAHLKSGVRAYCLHPTFTQALISVATRSLAESKLELGVNEAKVVEVRHTANHHKYVALRS